MGVFIEICVKYPVVPLETGGLILYSTIPPMAMVRVVNILIHAWLYHTSPETTI